MWMVETFPLTNICIKYLATLRLMDDICKPGGFVTDVAEYKERIEIMENEACRMKRFLYRKYCLQEWRSPDCTGFRFYIRSS